MKRMLTPLCLVLLCMIIGCEPATKADYLKEFESFVESVDENKTSDWANSDKEFKKFNDDLFKKFEDDLSMIDLVKVNAYRVRYNVKRHKSGLVDAIIGNEDIQKAREEIKYYLENDMKKDVDLLVQEASKVSDEFEKAIREAMDEIERELENQ